MGSRPKIASRLVRHARIAVCCAILSLGACTTTEAPTARSALRDEPVQDAALPSAPSAAPAEPVGDPSVTPARAQVDSTYPIHVSLGARARARRRAGNDDVDVYTTLDIDAGDAERHAWTARVSAQAIGDLDGREARNSPFFSLEDAQGSSPRVYLYEAYAERHHSGDVESVRLGRQTLDDTPVFLWIDGANARTRAFGPARVEFGAYGGVAVHQFETSSSGDRVYGAWSSARLAPRTSARVDWVHLDDGERFGGVSDDLVQLAAGQGIGERLRLDAAWSRLDGDDRDARLSALWNDAERELVVRAAWYQLLHTQEALALELDPFTSALLAQRPYWQTQLAVSKGFGERWRLDAGFDTRRLVHDDDEGLFNHDLDRVYVTATLSKLPLELELALTAETLDGGASDVDTWGADLSRRCGGGRRLSLGTAYALYKLDLFQADERQDVRTWYVRWVDRRREGWSFDLGYEYEDDPGEDLQLVRAGVTWRF